jgi:hypothetical protein
MDALKRKTAFILALTSALVVALAILITDDGVRERLGSNYFILALSIIGVVSGLLAGFVWDRMMGQRLKSLRDTAQAVQAEPGSPAIVGAEEDVKHDEIIGLTRQD